jgi:hypothetical protein
MKNYTLFFLIITNYTKKKLPVLQTDTYNISSYLAKLMVIF